MSLVEAGERVRQKVNNHNVFPVAPSAALNYTAFKWVMKEEFIYGHLSGPNACVNRMLVIHANIFPNESKNGVQNQSENLPVILVLSRLY